MVPYPPPPGHVEIVPPLPNDAAVWVDGQWLWQGAHWLWQPGVWVLPSAGARFARWETRRARDGRLLFAPPSWRGTDGRPLPAPEPIAPAESGTSGAAHVAGSR